MSDSVPNIVHHDSSSPSFPDSEYPPLALITGRFPEIHAFESSTLTSVKSMSVSTITPTNPSPEHSRIIPIACSASTDSIFVAVGQFADSLDAFESSDQQEQVSSDGAPRTPVALYRLQSVEETTRKTKDSSVSSSSSSSFVGNLMGDLVGGVFGLTASRDESDVVVAADQFGNLAVYCGCFFDYTGHQSIGDDDGETLHPVGGWVPSLMIRESTQLIFSLDLCGDRMAKQVLVGGCGLVRYELETGTEIGKYFLAEAEGFERQGVLGVSMGNQIGSKDLFSTGIDSKLSRWDVEKYDAAVESTGLLGLGFSLKYDEDLHLAVVGQMGGTVEVFDTRRLSSGALLQLKELLSDFVWDICRVGQSMKFLAVSEGGDAALWNVQTGKVLGAQTFEGGCYGCCVPETFARKQEREDLEERVSFLLMRIGEGGEWSSGMLVLEEGSIVYCPVFFSEQSLVG